MSSACSGLKIIFVACFYWYLLLFNFKYCLIHTSLKKATYKFGSQNAMCTDCASYWKHTYFLFVLIRIILINRQNVLQQNKRHILMDFSIFDQWGNSLPNRVSLLKHYCQYSLNLHWQMSLYSPVGLWLWPISSLRSKKKQKQKQKQKQNKTKKNPEIKNFSFCFSVL